MKQLYFLVVFCAVAIVSQAQERWKAGIGGNYVSNTFKESHLADYFAFSGNVSFTFLQWQKLRLSIENATTVRIASANSDADDAKHGITSSLPVVVSLQSRRTRFYAGSGPAYVVQKAETNQYYEKASGWFLNHLAGVGFTGKPLLSGFLTPEYNFRLSYLQDLSRPASDGAVISFIMFFK